MSKEKTSAYIDRISREYSLYVLNGGRAIPSLYDGLKMSQRIALWVIGSDSEKTLSLAGAMIQSGLYLHGNNSAENAISNLAAPFLNNIPYLTGIGAFGTKVDPSGFAAPRYTSVKKSEFARKNLFIDQDILPMVENYDGSASLPFSFFPLIPLILLNGVSGIAVGFASEILPRSFDQIKKATLEYIKTGKIKSDLTPTFQNYDVDVQKIAPGKFVISGKVVHVGKNTWRVTEILPDMKLEKLRETIIKNMMNKMVGNEEIPGTALVDDYIDNSQKKIDVEVKFFKPMTEPEVLKVLGLTEIRSENIVVLDMNGVKRIDDPETLIKEFVDWRLAQYATRYKNLIEKEKKEDYFWRAFMACLKGNKTVAPIPVSLNKYKGKAELKKAMEALIRDSLDTVDDEVVEKLLSLPVHRWTKVGIDECETKIAESKARDKEYKDILKSPERQKQVYIGEVSDLK